MLRAMRTLFSLVVMANSSCVGTTSHQAIAQPCTDEWFRLVEDQIMTGDAQGHGPDPGSLEWRSVVEFKLGIRDDPSVPPADSDQWCNYINERIIERAT